MLAARMDSPEATIVMQSVVLSGSTLETARLRTRVAVAMICAAIPSAIWSSAS
jgi:hypothetical protein